jgi:citrate lyase subunit beta / citryl-CoA lyase
MADLDDVHLRRSTLVVPADRPHMIEKAIASAADVLMLDMEDAVVYTGQAKMLAQQTVVEAMRSLDFGGKEVIVRVNELGSPWFDADMEACLQACPDAIVPAKTRTEDDLRAVDRRMDELGMPGDQRLWVGIETASAVLRCWQIGDASRRVELLRFGLGDYTVTMRGQFSDDNQHLLVPLTLVLATARSLGLEATAAAVVFSDFRNSGLVRQQAALLRKLGYDGATVIHPDHVEPVNDVFTPSGEEVAWALRQVAALDESGDAALVVDGQLVEMVSVKLARRTLAIAARLGLSADGVPAT